MSRVRAFSIVIALAVSQLVSGCATTSVAEQNQISIESVDSSSVRITRSYLSKMPEGLSLLGEIRGKFRRRIYATGHIHVEILNGKGSIVKKTEIKPRWKPGNRKVAQFGILLPIEAVTGSVVRLIHHDEKSHWNQDDTGIWKDGSVRNQFKSRSG